MLAYTDQGEGTPIVLIHGLGSRKEAWIPQHPLANNYRLIIPDLRGHGETVTETDITVPNFAADVLELLDSLEIESAFVCGLSLGGIVAQEIYKQAPDRVRGLILANTTSYISSLLALSVLFSASQHYKSDNFIEHIAEKGLYNKSYVDQAKQAFLIRDCYMEAARAPLELNYFPILSRMDKPVLLICGANDNVTPYTNQFLMKYFIKRVNVKVLEECGHLSNIEKANQFNYYLSQFIEEEAYAGN